jgi:hypothetical protein
MWGQLSMPKLNIKNPHAYVIEAAQRYGQDVQTVIEEMECGFEDAMTYVTGYDVQAWLDFHEDGLDIRLFAYMGKDIRFTDEIRVKEFNLDEIKPNTVKLINSRIRQRLELKQTLSDWKAFLPLIGNAYEGRITDHPVKHEPLQVELYREHHGVLETVHGICQYHDQPIHERKRYRLGQSRMWLIKNVHVEDMNGDKSIKILLSRNSSLLPQVLMRKLCQDSIPMAKLKEIVCVERNPGRFSQLLTGYELPRKAIARLSEELSERVMVTTEAQYRRIKERRSYAQQCAEVFVPAQKAVAR